MKIFNFLSLLYLFKFVNAEKNALIIVDAQNCFIDELPIYGATLSPNFISEKINNNIQDIDYIAVIKDTHSKNEINNKINWINSTGHHPSDLDVINRYDIGVNWWPTSVSLEYAKTYSDYLYKNNKEPIMMWPDHCILGTEGHNIINSIQNALNNWEKERNLKVIILEKGLNVYSEQYGILPEARFPIVLNDKNITLMTNEVIHILTTYSNITIIGDEYSHSVLPVLKDFYEISYDWLKLPVEHSPVINLNHNIIDEFQENTRNFLKWLGKKFGTLIDDFIEEIYLGDL